MKIAFAIKEMGPPLSGPERNLADLIRHLLDLGHEVHLFLHQCRALPDPRVRIHRVPVLPASSALRILSFAWEAGRRMAQGGFDIVHGFTQVYPQDVYF
jgi:glycosyltransferase involved in cell wall biosynthesis